MTSNDRNLVTSKMSGTILLMQNVDLGHTQVIQIRQRETLSHQGTTIHENCCSAAQLSATFSSLFSAALKLSWDFLSSSKNVQKFNCSKHLAGAWHFSNFLFLNPYDFTKINILKANCCILWIDMMLRMQNFSLLLVYI